MDQIIYFNTKYKKSIEENKDLIEKFKKECIFENPRASNERIQALTMNRLHQHNINQAHEKYVFLIIEF